jgi:hypothetical protein
MALEPPIEFGSANENLRAVRALQATDLQLGEPTRVLSALILMRIA